MKLQNTLFLTIILSLIYSSITFGAIVEGSKDTGLWVSLTNNEFDYVANHYQDELNSNKDESIIWVTEGGKMYPKSMLNNLPFLSIIKFSKCLSPIPKIYVTTQYPAQEFT